MILYNLDCIEFREKAYMEQFKQYDSNNRDDYESNDQNQPSLNDDTVNSNVYNVVHKDSQNMSKNAE